MVSTEKILEQIFDDGYATYDFKIADKYPVSIRSISANDYMSMDKALQNNKMTKIGFSQVFILERLSRVVISINNIKFKGHEEVIDYLKDKPSSFTDKLLDEHKKFEEEIKKSLQMEEIEDNFFEEGASPAK